MDYTRTKQEVNWARAAVLAGLALTVILCGGTEPKMLLYVWGPQAVLLISMFVAGARPAAVGGAALALAVFVGFFNWWAHKYAADNGLAWLLYLFSLPGGFIAGLVVARRLNRRDGRSPPDAARAAATWVIAGIAINFVSWHFSWS